TATGGHIAFDSSGDRLGPLYLAGQWGWLETRRPHEFASFSVARPFLREGDRQFSIGQPLGVLTGGRFSADGRMLAVGNSSLVMLCDPENGTRFRVKQDWHISACVFHPQTNHLLTADTNGILRHHPQWSEAGRLSFLKHDVMIPGSQWHALDITPDGQ